MRANVCKQQVRNCRLWLLLLLPAMVVAFTPLTPARMHLARSGGPEAVYRQATARITTRSLALRKAHVFRMVGSLEDQEQAETGDSEAHAPAIAEDAADGPAAAAEEEGGDPPGTSLLAYSAFGFIFASGIFCVVLNYILWGFRMAIENLGLNWWQATDVTLMRAKA